MEKRNTDEVNQDIKEICLKYQDERISGQWFITQTGLNKVCKLLGGNYKDLTKTQRRVIRNHCIDAAQGSFGRVKTWWFYINL